MRTNNDSQLIMHTRTVAVVVIGRLCPCHACKQHASDTADNKRNNNNNKLYKLFEYQPLAQACSPAGWIDGWMDGWLAGWLAEVNGDGPIVTSCCFVRMLFAIAAPLFLLLV